MPEVLEFSHSLYAPDAVREAITRFQDIARLELQADAQTSQVRVLWVDPEVPDLLDHFCNHVLHHSIVASRKPTGES